MCHRFLPLQRDAVDSQLGVVLPVTVGTSILLFTFELEDDQLVTAANATDRGCHPCIGKVVPHQQLPVVVGDRLDAGASQLQRFAQTVSDGFHADLFARSDAVLFSAGFDNRVHSSSMRVSAITCTVPTAV